MFNTPYLQGYVTLVIANVLQLKYQELQFSIHGFAGLCITIFCTHFGTDSIGILLLIEVVQYGFDGLWVFFAQLKSNVVEYEDQNLNVLL